MLKPSIDSLLKQVDSKYSLVILASKRAHELDAGATLMLEKYDSVKNVGRALEEVDAGDVIIDPEPELKRAMKKRREDEKKEVHDREQRQLETRIQQENI